MITEQVLRTHIAQVTDPLLGVTLAETEGILEIRINEEKNHVSL